MTTLFPVKITVHQPIPVCSAAFGIDKRLGGYMSQHSPLKQTMSVAEDNALDNSALAHLQLIRAFIRNQPVVVCNTVVYNRSGNKCAVQYLNATNKALAHYLA